MLEHTETYIDTHASPMDTHNIGDVLGTKHWLNSLQQTLKFSQWDWKDLCHSKEWNISPINCIIESPGFTQEQSWIASLYPSHTAGAILLLFLLCWASFLFSSVLQIYGLQGGMFQPTYTLLGVQIFLGIVVNGPCKCNWVLSPINLKLIEEFVLTTPKSNEM